MDTTLTAAERAAELNVGRTGFTLVEDAAHWAEYGIFTGEQLDRYFLYCDLVDTYKEVHGIKPRWISWQDSTTQELQAQLDNIYTYQKQEVERREAEEREVARKTSEAMEVKPLKVGLAAFWPS